MELRQLEYFVAVADETSFTRAAARCRIAQSALSTSIRALERELGAPLFLRTTRRVALTEPGRALLAEARRTLTAAEAARAAVAGVRGLLRGSLAVGGIRTRGLLDQAELLARFRRAHPEVEIRYVLDSSAALVEQVRSGRLDLAFVCTPPGLPPDLTMTTLFTRSMVLACRTDHPLVDQPAVSRADLARETLIGASESMIPSAAMERAFSINASRRRVPFHVDDVVAVLDFVAQGLGVALLVPELLAGYPELRAIPLAADEFADQDLTWTLAAVTPAADQPTPAARALLSLLPQATGAAEPPRGRQRPATPPSSQATANQATADQPPASPPQSRAGPRRST